VIAKAQHLSIQLALFISARMAINASYRLIYPFLPVLAAGMGVSLAQVSAVLAVRSLVGAAGPLLAPLSDHYGRKIGMLLGLGLFSLGIGLVAVFPVFIAFFAAMILAHLGNQVFLPAMQAYLGDRVPYQRRGRVLAFTEMSWSLSAIVLVPLSGALIAQAGWAAPFPFLAVLGGTAFVAAAVVVPRDPPKQLMASDFIWKSLSQVAGSPAARAALLFSLMMTAANEVVNLVFGAWMYQSFQLQIAALGLAASVIGAAELSGESATAWLADRIGKKRAIAVGLILSLAASAALPFIGQSLWGALLGLFVFYLGFEFALVSSIPFMTEVLPQSRATLMATNLAAFSLGRAVGAMVGPWLFAWGFGANAVGALVFNVLALLALSRVNLKES
jgi:predicted MFS family arabinose efflux permease